jgi:nicotinamide-nucleotide adenylyltransferase
VLDRIERSASSSVGLVSGSFDPMTVAHAALAEALQTEVTLLVYSPATLPKERGPGGEPHPPLLDEADRLASMRAWSVGHPGAAVAVCSHGLLADQAEAAAAAFPEARLRFGMGSDKVLQLFDPRWYGDRDADLGRLFTRAEVFYSVRPGDERRVEECLADNPRWRERFRRLQLPGDLAWLSSRAVRESIRRGRDVSALVPLEILPFVLRPEGPPGTSTPGPAGSLR